MYGSPGYTKEEEEKEFGSSDYQVTSLWNNPDRDNILRSIDINYYTVTEEEAKVMSLTLTVATFLSSAKTPGALVGIKAISNFNQKGVFEKKIRSDFEEKYRSISLE